MANWIAKAVGSGKGNLHKNLGIPLREKIPAKRIQAATHSEDPTIEKEANLAKTLKGLHGVRRK